MGKAAKAFARACTCDKDASGNFMPAEDFEHHTGLRGISGRWKFPRGMTPDAYQAHIAYSSAVAHDCYDFSKPYAEAKRHDPSPALMARMRKDWAEIAALNPGLSAVRVDPADGLTLHAALWGAASRFNAADINFFMETPRRIGSFFIAGHLRGDPATAPLFDEIEARAGRTLFWAPAPETLARISAALKPASPGSGAQPPRP